MALANATGSSTGSAGLRQAWLVGEWPDRIPGSCSRLADVRQLCSVCGRLRVATDDHLGHTDARLEVGAGMLEELFTAERYDGLSEFYLKG